MTLVLATAGCAAWIAFAGGATAQEGVAYRFEPVRNELARHDVATGARATIVPGLGNPRQLVLHGRNAWVVERDTGELSKVDLDTGSITTVATGLGSPVGLALAPTSGNREPATAYVADAGRLLEVDTGTGTSSVVTTGIAWYGTDIAISADGAIVYGVGSLGAQYGVIAIDVADGSATLLAPGSWAYPSGCVVISPDGGTLYFGDGYGVSPAALDLTNPSAPAVQNALGSWPSYFWQVDDNFAVSADGTRAAAIGSFNTVSVYDLTTDPATEVCSASFGFESATFQDADTLLLTNSWVNAIYSLDVPTGVLTAVDRGLHAVRSLEVVGATACVSEPNAVSSTTWSPITGYSTFNEPGRILAVDLASGSSSTIYSADPPRTFVNTEARLHSTQDGAKLYFFRWNNSGVSELVELDRSHGATRIVASIPGASDFCIDEIAGHAYVARTDWSPGSPVTPSLLQIDLVSGATIGAFVGASGAYGVLSDFGVDAAAGRAMGISPSSGRLVVIGFAGSASWLEDSVSFSPSTLLSRAQPASDDRSLYALVQSNTPPYLRKIVRVDMLSPSHPQTPVLDLAESPFGAGAMRVLDTADGPGVVATPTDATTGGSPVTLTFDTVTGAGDTTLATNTTGPATPTGFQLGGAGVYYEIHTTATFDGTVELCIDYTGTSFADESTLQLLHYEKNKWVNVTTERDPATNMICGVVKSFSPFVVVEFPAMTALADLVVRVHNLDVKHGIVVSLDAKLDAAQQALDHALSGNRASAVSCMNAFIAEVRAQNSKQLPASVADGLVANAQEIIALLGG